MAELPQSGIQQGKTMEQWSNGAIEFMNPKILEKDIISLLGLENLPENEKAALLAKMADLVFSRITTRILDILSEEDQKKFDELLKKKASQEKINEFLGSRIKNLDEIQAAEILRFKEEVVADADYLKKNLKK